MKIFTQIKTLALVAGMMFANNAMFAVDVTTTEGGQLSSKITSEEKLTITELSVTGPLNGADILFIREMAGAGYQSNSTTDGKLVSLNLKNASIVAGGEYYKNQTCVANTIGKYMFNKCKNLTTLILPDNITEIAASAMATDGPSVSELNIPASVASIGASAFTSLTALTKVTFDEESNLKTIGKSAFSIYNGLLEDITLPNSVETIDNSVFTNSKITKFAFPTSLKTLGNQVFQNVTTLTEISEIPASLETIGDNVFQGTSIAAVTVNSGNTHFKVDKNVLYNFDKTIAIWLPAKSTQATVRLPATVTEIKGSAFFGCEALKAVYLPDGLTTINGAAFKQSGITAITLPASLTTLNGTSQFEKCADLAYFCVKGAIEKLTSMMLQNCPNLSTMVFENATAPKFFKNSINGCAEDVTLYAPETSLAAYKSAVETGDAGSSPGPATDKTVTYVALDKLALYDFMNNNMELPVGDGQNLHVGDLADVVKTMGDVTISFTAGNNPGSRYFYSDSKGYHFNPSKNSTFTLKAAEGKAIKGVNIIFQASANGLTVNNGTYEAGTWTGNAEAVTFTASGARYIYYIVVTVDEKDEQTVTGVKEIEAANNVVKKRTSATGVIYDLNGNRVNLMQKGNVYIIDGMKYFK